MSSVESSLMGGAVIGLSRGFEKHKFVGMIGGWEIIILVGIAVLGVILWLWLGGKREE